MAKESYTLYSKGAESRVYIYQEDQLLFLPSKIELSLNFGSPGAHKEAAEKLP